jgi:endo-beta-N-acetylglucosaminidase D
MDCDGSAIERQIPIIKSQINDKTAYQQKLQAEINKFVSTNAKLVSKNHENDTQYAQHRHQVQLNDKSITHLEEKVASIETKVVSLCCVLFFFKSRSFFNKYIDRKGEKYSTIRDQCGTLQIGI